MGPELIPDFLALVGDAQDGYPGISGIGRTTAARLLNQYGPIEASPPTCWGRSATGRCSSSMLATLRTDAPLFRNVDELEWRGPTARFAEWAERIGDKRLLERCLRREALAVAGYATDFR